METKIKFGAYDGNNKSRKKLDCWLQSWNDVSQENYIEGFKNMFYYLLDEEEQNVEYQIKNNTIHFTILQGSARVSGSFDGQMLRSSSVITKLENASPALMRKLLDKNQTLLFCRLALDSNNTIVAMMNVPIGMFTPNTIYDGWRELALLADEQDDHLENSFGQAVTNDNALKQAVPETEATIKYQYFKKWLSETLALLQTTNRADLLGLATYIPLTFIHRVNYLCAPKGILKDKLLNMNNYYWQNSQSQQISIASVLQNMTQQIQELNQLSEQEVKACFFRTRDTFSTKGGIQQQEVANVVNNSIKDVQDSQKRSSSEHTSCILEFAMGNIIHDFNINPVFTELYHLQMNVLHPEFFKALGVQLPVFSADNQQLNTDLINQYVYTSVGKSRKLYPSIDFEVNKLDYTNPFSFCLSLTRGTAKMITTLD